MDFPLIGHLQEEQVSQLLDIIAVIHAVMPQRMTEAPQFVNYITHLKISIKVYAAIAVFISLMMF
jgi:uncharacterized pyridoxal phosphate-containing UPF0001 family protein